VRAEVASPQTASDRRSLEALVASVYSPPERVTTSVPTHEIDELLLLSSWFRRNPAELDNTSSADRLQVVK
jgi:hypothetical protein